MRVTASLLVLTLAACSSNPSSQLKGLAAVSGTGAPAQAGVNAAGAAADGGSAGRQATVANAAVPDAAVTDASVADASAPDAAASEDAALPDSDDAGADPTPAPAPEPLPCAVQAALSSCTECHGIAPRYGAPMSLTNVADLKAPSRVDASQTVIQRVLARVNDDATPMPPAPRARLSMEKLAALQQWVTDGEPAATGSCEEPVPPPLGAAGSGGDSGYVPPENYPKPDDCESTFEIKAHGGTGLDDQTKFSVAAAPSLENNQYHCFYFAPPFDNEQSVLWYEPILDNIKHVHHWILYTTENATHESGTSAPCNATQPGAAYVAIWAPGANNTSIPSDVGLQLPTGPRAGLILELHYYNDSGEAQEDASGIRFCTGRADKRPHTAVTHQTGTEGICLQPNTEGSVTGRCAPRQDLGAAHIRGIWPHLHKLGRRMVVTIHRASGEDEVIHDQPFDFNNQVFYPKDIVFNPGDTLDTSCYYQNASNEQVHFGERTQDEMCYGFIMAWPPDSLAHAPAPASPFGGGLFGGIFGGGTSTPTGPIHRCVEDSSILQSCNGYADLPATPVAP